MKIISNTRSKITPEIQQTDYIVGSDLLANLNKISNIAKIHFGSFLLLSDETVFKLYGQKVFRSLNNFGKNIVVSTVPSGEKSKDFRILPKIIKPYFRKGFDKKSCVISLGGGVITDIGGFLASILLRGIPNINIPTTLLGQVDAAIGGKSGVDFWLSKNLMYKNMIGTINQPSLVVSDVETLKTLPDKEILNGLGEIVKYWVGWGKPTKKHLGWCADALLRGGRTKKSIKTLPRCQADLDKTPQGWPAYKDSSGVEELVKTISICQQIKIDTIQKDPFDTLHIREKLNLGHTIGHAVEGVSNGLLSHGESVAIGLIAAVKISLLNGFIDNQTHQLIVKTVQSLGLPTKIPKKVKFKTADLLKEVKMDKKGGTFVLIKNIGELEADVLVEEELVKKVLLELTRPK